MTGDILGAEAYESWLKKSKLMNVQNIHRVEQYLRKAILFLPYYSGIHPCTLCIWEDKLLTTIQSIDLGPAGRHDGIVQVAPYRGLSG